jgi:hypothetical protein
MARPRIRLLNIITPFVFTEFQLDRETSLKRRDTTNLEMKISASPLENVAPSLY